MPPLAIALVVSATCNGVASTSPWPMLMLYVSPLNQPWFKGDTYNMSIGQGDVLATPLQVADTTNAIANGGMLYQPHLAKSELDSEGNVLKELFPTPQGRPVPVDQANL